MPFVSQISAGEGLAEMILELDVVTWTGKAWRPAWAGEHRGDLQGDAGAHLLGGLSCFLLFCSKRLTSDS